VKITQKGENAEKIGDFPCKSVKFMPFWIMIFYDVLIDFSIPFHIFGHTLGTVLHY
jgi:hypothetical protein